MNTNPPGSSDNTPEQHHDSPSAHRSANQSPGTEQDTSAQKYHPEEQISRYFLLGLLTFATIIFIPIIIIFTNPLILATAFTVLFFPLYRRIVKLFRGKRGISAFLCCFILLIGLLFPVYILLNLVIRQMIELYSTAEPQIRELIEQGRESAIFRRLTDARVLQWINLSTIDWPSILQNFIERLAAFGTIIINRTSAGVFGLVADIFITLFTMFYFFMDGESLLRRIRYLFPVRTQYFDFISSRFLLITRATITGTLVIGVIQGTLGAITLLIFGIRAWLLWGFIMVILAILPLLGAWLVLIPAGIIQLLLGNLWQGVGILITSFILISNIDNVIRPRLVGRGAKMHDLLIFFSTLGGLSLFGVSGFITGPVIASFFVSVIDIYETEFRSNLQRFESI